MALFESYDRRIDNINAVLNQYGINGIEDAKAICEAKGLDPYTMCKETQPICFENACWAYVVGAAIAIKKGCVNAADAAEAIGEGLQAFCIKGSVADDRKGCWKRVGLVELPVIETSTSSFHITATPSRTSSTP